MRLAKAAVVEVKLGGSRQEAAWRGRWKRSIAYLLVTTRSVQNKTEAMQ